MIVLGDQKRSERLPGLLTQDMQRIPRRRCAGVDDLAQRFVFAGVPPKARVIVTEVEIIRPDFAKVRFGNVFENDLFSFFVKTQLP